MNERGSSGPNDHEYPWRSQIDRTRTVSQQSAEKGTLDIALRCSVVLIAPPAGFEPATNGLEGHCSIP